MYGRMENCKCIVCSSDASKLSDYDDLVVFYVCPVCGRYEIHFDLSSDEIDFDLNQLGSYFIYNGFKYGISERRYYSNRDKEWCDEWSNKCKEGDITHGHPVFLSKENVENWYPKIFSEKIDRILLFLNKEIKHIGEDVTLSKEELYSAFFVDRFDYSTGKREERDTDIQLKQANYMLDYLADRNYIRSNIGGNWWSDNNTTIMSLLPEGYARIDELQKTVNL